MTRIFDLWRSRSKSDWEIALKAYWNYVRPENLVLERRLNELKLDIIADLDQRGWYQFLHDEYFRWKYTAPNRYATTTKSLRRYRGQIFDNEHPEYLYHVNAAYAIVSAFSAIEELGRPRCAIQSKEASIRW